MSSAPEGLETRRWDWRTSDPGQTRASLMACPVTTSSPTASLARVTTSHPGRFTLSTGANGHLRAMGPASWQSEATWRMATTLSVESAPLLPITTSVLLTTFPQIDTNSRHADKPDTFRGVCPWNLQVYDGFHQGSGGYAFLSSHTAAMGAAVVAETIDRPPRNIRGPSSTMVSAFRIPPHSQ